MKKIKLAGKCMNARLDPIKKVELAEHSGFCFGVRRAIKLAQDAARRNKLPIYSLGPLIHNRQEVERLKGKGIHVIEDLSGMESETLIVRSHGIHPKLLKEAKSKGFSIVDATCPFVQKVHQIVAFLKEEGYKVIVIGEKKHPEILALPGVKVVEKKADVSKMQKREQLGIVSQTTQTIENFNEVVQALLSKASELRIFNTICLETVKRQESTRELAGRVDSMVVVGGYNSANTRRLAEICRRTGTETRHIETADEIKLAWFKEKRAIGITAGASTPGWLIREVMRKLGAAK
jgi:4-hydroxy-3-methylbut-2-enyl diphosphate reductase